MNISSIPTDNLYKFLAISGLVIIITCLYLPYKQIREIDLKYIELKSETQLLEEKNYILNVKKKLVEDIKSSTSEDALKILNERAELLQEAPIISKRWEQLIYLNNEKKELRKITNVGLGFGVIITFIGFFQWYRRLQKYQDILMKREAESLSSTIKDENSVLDEAQNNNEEIALNGKLKSNL